MSHTPILFKNVSLTFPKKTCFANFTTQLHPGSRIGIIGRNGSGKSSLLHLIQGNLAPSEGEVRLPPALSIAYVEQTIEAFPTLSGGQRFNKRLTEALLEDPDLLLLDEPTNHLDRKNRKSLIQMLRRYSGTLVIVSHDTELLRSSVDTLWHIDQEEVHEFTGSYDGYMRARLQQREQLSRKLEHLERVKKETHEHLMKEQKRAAKSRAKGQKSIDQRKWPTVVSKAKALRAEQTSGKKKAAIRSRKEHLKEQLDALALPEEIVPTFTLSSRYTATGTLLSIHNGSVGYSASSPLLTEISLSLNGGERLVLQGKNGSGKSTLLKALLGNPAVIKFGSWTVPKKESIGYLDQHYSTLNPEQSALEMLKERQPTWEKEKVRHHLAAFLFRTNQEVNQKSSSLSGGEKARLSLCLLAAAAPSLLILDEITNNLDLETKEHVIQVLKHFPGAMLIVSHDKGFIQELDIEYNYPIGE